MIDIDRERARFEEWARQSAYLMDRRTDTKSVMYESLATRCAWDGWVAARRKREVVLWRYINFDGISYKWNDGAPTEDDRKNVGIGDHIQVAYSE